MAITASHPHPPTYPITLPTYIHTYKLYPWRWPPPAPCPPARCRGSAPTGLEHPAWDISVVGSWMWMVGWLLDDGGVRTNHYGGIKDDGSSLSLPPLRPRHEKPIAPPPATTPSTRSHSKRRKSESRCGIRGAGCLPLDGLVAVCMCMYVLRIGWSVCQCGIV